jgi:hypothetical protein
MEKLTVKQIRFVILLVLTMVLMGCSSANIQDMINTPQPTINLTAIFQNALLTATWAVPTPTLKIQAPIHLLPSTTPYLTNTPLPFSNFRFMGTGLIGNDMVFGINAPGISANFKAKVNNEDYTCFTQPNDADMLYCKGAPIKEGSTVNVSIFPLDGQQAVITFNMVIPGSPKPTQRPVVLAIQNSPTPPKSDPTERVCPEYCALYYENNGDELRQCGYKTPDDAWVQVRIWAAPGYDTTIPDPSITNHARGAECVDEHHANVPVTK